MTWWMGSYSYPPAVETCLCERQGVLSGRKKCCSTRRWGLYPWCGCSCALSLHQADRDVTQGCELFAVGDPSERPDCVLHAASTLWGDGSPANLSPKVFLPFSSDSLVFYRPCGRKKEIIIKFKRGKEQKGNVTFFPFPRVGLLVACTACCRSSCCCIPVHHSILASVLSPIGPLSSSLEVELLHWNILKVKPNYVQYNSSFYFLNVF